MYNDKAEKKYIDINKGFLNNGIRYYCINSNINPSIIELYLVVKVGSTSDFLMQKGSAHYLEHMLLAFDDDRRYLKYLIELTGYTNFDETVFHIACTNKDQSISRAIELIMRIATGDTLEENKMEKVRKDILEEWEYQINHEEFIKKNNPFLEKAKIEYALEDSQETVYFQFRDGRFEERNLMFPYMKRHFNEKEDFPVGKLEHIRNMDFHTIKSFHKENYQINNLAVIAIGDIQEHKLLEAFANIRFQGILHTQSSGKRKKYITNKDSYIFKVHSSKKEVSINIHLFRDYESKKVKELGESLTEEIVLFMLGQYIEKQLIIQNYKIKEIYTEGSWIMKDSKLYSVNMLFDEINNEENTYKEIIRLISDFRIHNLSIYQKRQIKKAVLEYLKYSFTEIMLNKCIAEYIFDKEKVSRGNYYQMAKHNINQLTANKINKVLKNIRSDSSMYIFCKGLGCDEKLERLNYNIT